MSLYAVSVTRDVDGAVAEIEVEAETPEKAKRSASARARHNSDALFPPIVPSFHADQAIAKPEEVKALDVEELIPEPEERSRRVKPTRGHGKVGKGFSARQFRHSMRGSARA